MLSTLPDDLIYAQVLNRSLSYRDLASLRSVNSLYFDLVNEFIIEKYKKETLRDLDIYRSYIFKLMSTEFLYSTMSNQASLYLRFIENEFQESKLVFVLNEPFIQEVFDYIVIFSDVLSEVALKHYTSLLHRVCHYLYIKESKAALMSEDDLQRYMKTRWMYTHTHLDDWKNEVLPNVSKVNMIKCLSVPYYKSVNYHHL
jgi:hypothetical protein